MKYTKVQSLFELSFPDRRQLQMHPLRLLVRGQRDDGLAPAGAEPPRRRLDDEWLGADHDRPSTGLALRQLRSPIPLQFATSTPRQGDRSRGEPDRDRRVSTANQMQSMPASRPIVGGTSASPVVRPCCERDREERRGNERGAAAFAISPGALFLLVLLDEFRHRPGRCSAPEDIQPQRGGQSSEEQRQLGDVDDARVPSLQAETGESVGAQETSSRRTSRALLQVTLSILFCK